jgi:GWxTD domain-containing protein
MRLFLCLFLLAITFVCNGQTIASTNFRYWYDPDNEGQFQMRIVRAPDSMYIYYKVDTTIFALEWERRDSYGERGGDAALGEETGDAAQGRVAFPVPSKPWILVSKLTDKRTQEVRLDFHLLEANYPPDGLVWRNGKPVFTPYIPANAEVTITNTFGPKLKVYHYAEKFPAASPAFAEKEQQVDPIMTVDSTFQYTSGQPIRFTKEGLYLVQSDTNAARGISFRVSSSSYPKSTKVEELSPELVFISTKEEADKLQAAGADKTAFERVILDITRDKERAKTLIKNYFSRIEDTNRMFTSYKEGWKTDRGMIYLVFGLPDEVNRNGQFEVWTYKGITTKFTFHKTGSVYDPDYFVLERKQKFAEAWYYTVDTWRKSQITSAVRN